VGEAGSVCAPFDRKAYALYRSKPGRGKRVQAITSTKTLNAVIRRGVALLDFNAPWCGPCRSQEPILQELANRYRRRATLATINIDDHRELAAKFQIRSIPTLIIFKDGRELQRLVGLQGFDNVSAMLDAALEMPV
jgi:thioredoxin 1